VGKAVEEEITTDMSRKSKISGRGKASEINSPYGAAYNKNLHQVAGSIPDGVT
jgi:hypothetical protein